MTIGYEPSSSAQVGRAVERSFRAMGCDVRIVAWEDPQGSATTELEDAVLGAERLVHACDERLTRFSTGSEVSRLNADPAGSVVVSPLLARAVAAARHAAEESGGLIDPTLLRPLVASGYASDWDPGRRVPVRTLLAAAAARQPASPHPAAAWASVHIDLARRIVSRPPGLELDLGATAKGLIADLALRALGPVPRAFVDAGGDLAIHADTIRVLAEDPFGREPVVFSVFGQAGIATSSIAGRCWITDEGPAHHLLDPATGRPAFTGIVQATACAPSATEAERLAGQALLAGPARAPAILAKHGGLLVLDDGDTRHIPGGHLR